MSHKGLEKIESQKRLLIARRTETQKCSFIEQTNDRVQCDESLSSATRCAVQSTTSNALFPLNSLFFVQSPPSPARTLPIPRRHHGNMRRQCGAFSLLSSPNTRKLPFDAQRKRNVTEKQHDSNRAIETADMIKYRTPSCLRSDSNVCVSSPVRSPLHISTIAVTV